MRALLAAAALSAAVFASSPVAAYCRLTTCQPVESCPTDEAGCPSIGAALRWEKLPIPYRLHARGYSKIPPTPLRAAIRAAFRQWTEVTCSGGKTSLALQELPDAQPNEESAPFSVVMVNAGWRYEPSALAQTTHDFGVEGGIVHSAIVEVNTAEHDFLVADDDTPLAEDGAADIESVLAHEAGHYIGLAHSNVPGALMAPQYCEDDDRCKHGARASRALGEDDIAAVCALYPAAAEAPDLGSPPGDANATAFGCAVSRPRVNTPQGGILALLVCLSATGRLLSSSGGRAQAAAPPHRGQRGRLPPRPARAETGRLRCRP